MREELVRQMLRYVSVGVETVCAVFIGMGMGWGLDRALDTAPWLTLVFTLFGLAAAVKNLLRYRA